MNHEFLKRPLTLLPVLARSFALALTLLVTGLLPGVGNAAVTNISQTPLLSTDGTGTVKPNLMLLFDNSVSMTYHYTPDYVGSPTIYLCRSNATQEDRLVCAPGHPPFMSSDFNKQYYDPKILYTPPIKADGITSYPTMNSAYTTGWTKVTTDGFSSYYRDLSGTSVSKSNLITGFPDLQWCDTGTSSGSGRNSTVTITCKANTAYAYPDATYKVSSSVTGAPYYYTIGVAEYCTSATLVTCRTASAATTAYPIAAKVRWCNSTALTTCQAKRVGTYTYPRFSTATGTASPFTRVDIKPGYTYTKAITRTDCAGTSCTYDEEMTNFANWYAYYKTRMQMMKTSVGLAFAPLTSSYKVGFFKLSTASVTDSSTVDILPTAFNATARAAWYTMLYGATTDGSTPLRIGLDNAGKVFANKSPYTQAVGSEVVTAPCQQNFLILTTDGYWNLGSSTTVTSNDESENASRFCTNANGCVDERSQTKQSLADVALFWYNGGSNDSTISLREDLEPNMSKPGLVSADTGENTHLHMTTFTLGLGVDGIMTYDSNYDNGQITIGGDFYNLINRTATGCAWNSNGKYVWPNPNTSTSDKDTSNVQERVDDLWHAAVNGHGKYFSASNPSDVVSGLGEAINKMQTKTGAATGAATSTPNVSAENRDVFSSTFTTVRWTGELKDYYIDTSTGIVATTAAWSTTDQLGKQIAAASDTRRIYMYNTAGTTLKSFLYANMTSAEKAWFDNRCTSLAQCGTLTTANKAIVNSGTNIVNWLRGQQQYADDTILRAYYTPAATLEQPSPLPIVLGDIASAKPTYLYDARKSYTLTGYDAFKVSSLTRRATVFAAANDGMLHAFYAPSVSTVVPTGKEAGKEIWAYMPRITMKKLPLQASTTYGSNHQYTVDGSPEVGDVQNSAGTWKTVLVGGLNGGGRGYYALDVTDPENPLQLWELCADSAVCTQHDDDIGLTYGNAQFGKWAGKWVVYLTSGYNNVSGVDSVATGSGVGYLYIVDVMTGAVLKKISTGSGSVTTPSGLAKITSISLNPSTDPVTTYVYGGDTLGQMWRFDLTDTTGVSVPVLKMGSAGSGQPITTRPDVTTCKITSTTAGSTTTTAGRVVVFGTGRMLDIPDVTDTTLQSFYMLKDSGSTVATIHGGTGMVQQSLTRVGTSGTYKVSNNAVDLSTKAGWYIDLNQNAGERVNLDPKVAAGAVNLVTNVPSTSSACTVGGSSNVYQFDVCTGSYLYSDQIAGNQLSNTSGAVGFTIVRLPSGVYKMISTLADGTMVTTSLSVPGLQPAHKVGWRRVKN
jgi:type IV pilus assembly protein PilY1